MKPKTMPLCVQKYVERVREECAKGTYDEPPIYDYETGNIVPPEYQPSECGYMAQADESGDYEWIALCSKKCHVQDTTGFEDDCNVQDEF